MQTSQARLQAVRVAAALLVAATATAMFAWYWHGTPSGRPDFDQLYKGALALRHGQNPYTEVGPGRAYQWTTPLFYPLPALLAIVPFTWLQIRVAGGLFVAISGFLLGWAIERRGDRWALLMLTSNAFSTAVAAGQWSLLFVAAAWLPLAGLVAIAKPNVAAVVASGWTRAMDFFPAVLGAIALGAVSFALRPHWISEWRGALGSAPWQHSPIRYPGGFLAVAALLRWRRSEARYLLAYALIPQTPGPYTDLLLFAIPRGRWQMLVLSALSYLTFPVLHRLSLRPTTMAQADQYGAVSTILLMLPCLVMLVLRPNQADHEAATGNSDLPLRFSWRWPPRRPLA